ncbi:polypyrimidine tract-binding protein [Trifolium repens]|nr:polypyrimidine tract-binding protein [Trifolium repens]
MLFGKQLDVTFSTYRCITQGADTHEYMNSNLNRFNRNAAKNYRYCCSPTRIIHVSSLPQDISEGERASLLVEHRIIVNIKVFETNGKKQAFGEFETEEKATEALVCKHALSLSGWLIHISFSQLQKI